MTPRITAVEHLVGYTLKLTFADGTQGTVDLADQLWGEMFEPLKDEALFRKVTVHPELNTISWPNGADLAPEFLYSAIAA